MNRCIAFFLNKPWRPLGFSNINKGYFNLSVLNRGFAVLILNVLKGDVSMFSTFKSVENFKEIYE